MLSSLLSFDAQSKFVSNIVSNMIERKLPDFCYLNLTLFLVCPWEFYEQKV